MTRHRRADDRDETTPSYIPPAYASSLHNNGSPRKDEDGCYDPLPSIIIQPARARSLGMGYGFTVTPILLLLGFGPRQAVPSVLSSSFVGALTSSFFHHRFRNVDFSLRGDS